MLKTIDKKVKYNGYVHLQSFEPEGILDLVGSDAKPVEVELQGRMHRIKVRSLRLQCFKRSNQCVRCGLKGTIISADTFTTKSDRDGTHFNFYAIYEGKTRLMTKDHIIPKSKGGPDHLDNLQTMCDQCNHRKGSKLPEDYVDEKAAPFGDGLNITLGVLT